MDRLIDLAAEPYRAAGRFAYGFARGKLRGDPVFRAILERGLLLGCRSVLDLGCGQGLLIAWLRAARRLDAEGAWPLTWAAAPTVHCIRGVELAEREVRRALRALGTDCNVTQGDIRSAEIGHHDAVVVFDVLHYMAESCQERVLRRIHAALPSGGLLLLRVGDADGGFRFRLSQVSDHVVLICRGYGFTTLHCRGARAWQVLLDQHGFDSEATPMSAGTPFANVLLTARAR
jgi:cyclopropane fatty-acyl-phospholipid synthase-like methyltransferase